MTTDPLSRLRAEVKAAYSDRIGNLGLPLYRFYTTATRLARAVADEGTVEKLARTICEAGGDDWLREGPRGLMPAYGPQAQAVLTALASLGLGEE